MAHLTAAAIQRCVADAYGVSMIDMHNRVRVKRVSRPRAVAMYLARELTDLSFPEIGMRFAHRDHSTIIKDIGRLKLAMVPGSELAEKVANIRAVLTGIMPNEWLEHPIPRSVTVVRSYTLDGE